MGIGRKIAAGIVFVIFIFWIAFSIHSGLSGEFGRGIKGIETRAADIFWIAVFGGIFWYLITKERRESEK